MYNFDEIVNRQNTAAAKWNEVTALLASKRKDGERQAKERQAKERQAGGTQSNAGQMAEMLVPLTTADMEFKTCPAVIEVMKARLDHGIFGYTKPDERFFKAVSTFVKKHHGFDITKEMLICTTSAVPAIVAGIKACTEEGDGIILFSPAYTAFYTSIRNTNRELMDCPLMSQNDSYEIDFSLFEELARNAKSRLVILCNPHNPVGRVWTKQEMQKIFEICRRNDLYVIADEIHWDLILQGEHVSAGLFAKECNGKLLLCTAPSKTFNLAGAQLAYTIVFEEGLKQKVREELLKTGQSEAISIFGYESLIAAYENGEEWFQELIKYLQKNEKLFRTWLLINEPDIRMARLEGTYLAWLDCRNVKPGFTEWFALLQQHGVFLTDGAYFGQEGEGFVRVNLALPKESLLKVLDQWEKLRK